MLRRFFLAALLLAMSAAAQAAPKAEPWPRWQPFDASSTRAVDHAPWDTFLMRYVTVDQAGVDRLAYGQVADADRKALSDYIAALGREKVTALARSEQLALWINLYNALTVRVVLEHYPVKSIRDIDISPGIFSDGPWGKKLTEVEGEPLSLDDIEHRILRPIWKDPRVHYAVNCASVGCPDLRASAYRAADIDAVLDAAARSYVNDPRGVAVKDGRVTASSIYDWFQSDFGGSEAGVLDHLRRYAAPVLVEKLKTARGIDGYAYDWRLNE